jgi:hypothetical protein
MSRHNVLLVVADSLRARNTSALGYRRATTPFLDAFAEEATVYTQARSPSNWTVPSHVSTFTGHEVHEHGVDHTAKLDAGHTIFEELAGAGYDTALFSDNPFLTDHESGLDEVFQTAVGSPEQYDSAYETNGSLGDWPNGFWYADRTLEWIDSRESEWAACINLMDTHRPYEPLAEYDQWSDERSRELQESMGYKWHWEFLSGNLSLGFAGILEQIYDGAVRQADAIFESLIRGLDERGVLDDTEPGVNRPVGRLRGERKEDGPTAVIGVHGSLPVCGVVAFMSVQKSCSTSSWSACWMMILPSRTRTNTSSPISIPATASSSSWRLTWTLWYSPFSSLAPLGLSFFFRTIAVV